MPTPELNKALAAVQAAIPHVAKGEKANTGSYTYEYADLTAVTKELLPLLGKHGLAFTAWPTLDDGRFVLAYALVHASGEERTGLYPLPEKGTPQQLGGHITYARRYALCAVTGVAPGGDDNDAAGAPEMQTARPQASSNGGRWMNRPLDVPPSHLQAQRTPAKTTGAEHEQLRHGTVEAAPDDRRSARVKAGQNGGDPWQDQPPGELDDNPLAPEERPGTLDGRQRSQIMGKLGRLPHEERAAKLTEITGREIDSTNELSHVEAQLVIRILADEAKAAAEVGAP